MANDVIAEENTESADFSQDDTTSSDASASPDTAANAGAANTDDTASAKDADGDEADGAGEAEPIDYSTITVPEGMDIDEASLGEFKDIAAAMNDGKGLSQADAQKLVDFRAEMVKQQLGDWETTFSEWRGELLSDKEIGGDKFMSETVPNVLAAAERYGDKDLLNLLQTNKMYGENPHLVRMMNRIGEELREDKLSRGRAAGDTSDEARLRRLYPSHYNEDGSVKDRHKGAPA